MLRRVLIAAVAACLLLLEAASAQAIVPGSYIVFYDNDEAKEGAPACRLSAPPDSAPPAVAGRSVQRAAAPASYDSGGRNAFHAPPLATEPRLPPSAPFARPQQAARIASRSTDFNIGPGANGEVVKITRRLARVGQATVNKNMNSLFCRCFLLVSSQIELHF